MHRIYTVLANPNYASLLYVPSVCVQPKSSLMHDVCFSVIGLAQPWGMGKSSLGCLGPQALGSHGTDELTAGMSLVRKFTRVGACPTSAFLLPPFLSPSHPCILLLPCSFPCFTHARTHSLTHSLTRACTHALIHAHTHTLPLITHPLRLCTASSLQVSALLVAYATVDHHSPVLMTRVTQLVQQWTKERILHDVPNMLSQPLPTAASMLLSTASLRHGDPELYTWLAHLALSPTTVPAAAKAASLPSSETLTTASSDLVANPQSPPPPRPAQQLTQPHHLHHVQPLGSDMVLNLAAACSRVLGPRTPKRLTDIAAAVAAAEMTGAHSVPTSVRRLASAALTLVLTHHQQAPAATNALLLAAQHVPIEGWWPQSSGNDVGMVQSSLWGERAQPQEGGEGEVFGPGSALSPALAALLLLAAASQNLKKGQDEAGTGTRGGEVVLEGAAYRSVMLGLAGCLLPTIVSVGVVFLVLHVLK